MTARLLACLLSCAGTALAAVPEPGTFMRDVEAARVDPAQFDFAAAGFWALDPSVRAPWPWIAAVRPGEQTADFMSSCRPEDQRRFAGLGWSLLASKAPDAASWQAARDALTARLAKYDAWLDATANAAKSAGSPPAVAELLQRHARDQGVRLAMTDQEWLRDLSALAAEHWGWLRDTRMLATDCDNTRWLKEQMAKIGWFDARKYGEDADSAAWFLVQHADRDPEFQRQTLAMLQKLPKAATSQRRLAYLVDRVERAAGRPQVYGTQWSCTPEGNANLQETIDPDRLNERRMAVGLEPMDPAPRVSAPDCPQPVK